MENQAKNNRWIQLIDVITKIANRSFSIKVPRSDKNDQVEAVILTLQLTLEHFKMELNRTLYIHPEDFVNSYTLKRFTLDKQLRVDRSNEAAQPLLKGTGKDILYRPFKELLHNDSYKEWEKIKNKLPLPPNESLGLHLKFPDSNGQALDAYCSLDHSEFIDGYCLTCHVITSVPGDEINGKRKNRGSFKKLTDREYVIVTELELFISESLNGALPKNSELAEMFGTNESKLVKIFKKVFGLTPYYYHRKLRLEQAKYMLENNIGSVKTISKIMGYADVSHFSLDYKKQFGHPPSDDLGSDWE